MSKTKKKNKADGKKDDGSRNIAENRKARHRFEIVDTLECGIALVGTEVKSLRDGKLSLDESYARVLKGELWLLQADIPEYTQGNQWNHDPKRPRKLLIHRQEIQKFANKAHENGLTLVPLRMYFNARGMAKLTVGLCKGRKLHDKREALRSADVKRGLDRATRRRM
jgi:SsrA-binding protein